MDMFVQIFQKQPIKQLFVVRILMKKLVLIRHAHTQVEPQKANPLWQLSQQGIESMSGFVKNPLLCDMDVLYTSNQLKAIHTGIIIASELGIFLKQREDVTELTSLTNEWKEDYEGFITGMYSGAIERHEDGESLDEAHKRFSQAIHEIAEIEQEQDVVGVVAHGNVLSLFAAAYESRSALEIHHAIKMPDIAVLDWETKTFDVVFGG